VAAPKMAAMAEKTCQIKKSMKTTFTQEKC